MLSVSINSYELFVKIAYNLLCNSPAFGFALGLHLFEVTQGCQTTFQFLL